MLVFVVSIFCFCEILKRMLKPTMFLSERRHASWYGTTFERRCWINSPNAIRMWPRRVPSRLRESKLFYLQLNYLCIVCYGDLWNSLFLYSQSIRFILEQPMLESIWQLISQELIVLRVCRLWCERSWLTTPVVLKHLDAIWPKTSFWPRLLKTVAGKLAFAANLRGRIPASATYPLSRNESFVGQNWELQWFPAQLSLNRFQSACED